MLERVLEKIGLSEKEAKVYLAMLELGQATVQQIAKKAGINRPTAYFIIDGLAKKGLATSAEEGKKVFYTAETPQQLERLLEKQEQELKDKHEDLKKAFPEFEALFNLAANKPKVKFFEGVAGLESMSNEFYRSLQSEDQIFSFSPYDELNKHFPETAKDESNNRLKHGVWLHVIYHRQEGPVEDASSEKYKRNARFIPKDKFPFKILVSVVPGKRVQLTNMVDKISGVVIEDSTIADAMKAIWDLAWEAAEKYQ